MNIYPGYLSYPGMTYNAEVEVSGDHRASNFPFDPDAYLPVVYQDDRDPRHQAVMLGGRFVSVGNVVGVNPGSLKQRGLLNTNQTTVTLHDGDTLKPLGILPSKILKQSASYMQDGLVSAVVKQAWADVPFSTVDNEVHGTIRGGDRLTGGFGSVTSRDVRNFKKIGLPVLWNAKKLYSSTTAAASTHVLGSAVYPGIQPSVVAMFNAAGVIVTGAVTLSWNGSAWAAALPSTAVTTVLYEWGQNEDQIAAEAVDVINLVRVKERDAFLAYVKSEMMGDGLLSEAEKDYHVTTVSNETPSTVTAGRVYRVAYYPMSLKTAPVLEIKGVIVDANGNATTYSSDWYTMPTGRRDGFGDFVGDFHTINPSTGLITLSAAVSSVSSIRISYGYITNARNGFVSFDPGIDGLTDGSNLTAGATSSGVTVVPSNPRGIPSVYNLSNVVGALKMWVR